MNSIKKQISIFSFIAIVVAIAINNFLCDEIIIETVETIDTSKTEKLFTADEVSELIALNIEQVEENYKNNPLIINKIKVVKDKVNLDSLRNAIDQYWRDSLKTQDLTDKVFLSKVDTVFVNKDSTGTVTDSIHVNSIYLSRIPLSPDDIHSVSVYHKNYQYNKKITIIKQPVIDLKTGIVAALGYGLIRKEIDVFLGYGVQINLNIFGVL